jgi:hypothetical protein
MFDIGPVLFWTLIAYFALQTVFGFGYQLTGKELKSTNPFIGGVIALTFVFWLCVTHW